MIDSKGKILEYPKLNKLTTVGAKRKSIENKFETIIENVEESLKKQNSSILVAKPLTNQIVVQKYKINHDSITKINFNFIEVKARLVSGGGNFVVVPNKICSIDFGGKIQSLIETKLMPFFIEDLQKYHNTLIREIGNITMYVEKHNSKCPLPCDQIMSKQENNVYKDECLSSRIGLGEYYFPFIDNEIDNDDDYLLNNLFIYQNSCILGVGSDSNNMDKLPMFNNIIEYNNQVNCIISCKIHEIGVNQGKIILYLKCQGNVYYSDRHPSQITSGKSAVINLVKNDKRLKNELKILCCNENKKFPKEFEIDYDNDEEVDRFCNAKRQKLSNDNSDDDAIDNSDDD